MFQLSEIPTEIAVFIATHKSFQRPEGHVFVPLQLGNQPENLGYLRENQLDNIADKNPYFCELTALYFLWKNVHTPVIGLVHYRRYFAKKRNIVQRRINQLAYLLGLVPKQQTSHHTILTSDEIQQLWQNSQADLIVPAGVDLDTSLYDNYNQNHHIQDWHIVKQIVEEKAPQYSLTIAKVEQNCILYPYNMFIGKKEIINDYCEWLFDILFEAEKKIDCSQYDSYNQRVFGFLAERLFTAWIVHNQNKYKIKHVPVQRVQT